MERRPAEFMCMSPGKPEEQSHRVSRMWDSLGPFKIYEATPIHATQEWRSEEYFVAIESQNKWLSTKGYDTLSSAFRAMADYLDSR